MPAKYHIHTEPRPPRFRLPGKLGIVDWREDCARCHNCVKDACIYGLYRDEADTLHEEIGYLDYIYQCKGCLSCVQNCTKGILTRVMNPECKRLGDAYFTPDILLTTWFQAETGRIPVSGGGYGGPFSGSGFDSMWTDMSEIVRPTRDGIHGREYINTGVDIGRKMPHLAFKGDELDVTPPWLLQTPMPVMFDILPARWAHPVVVKAAAIAAGKLGLLSVVRADSIPEDFGVAPESLVPLLGEAGLPAGLDASPLVMVSDSPEIASVQSALKAGRSERIVAVRLPATPRSKDRVRELVKLGVEVVALSFDMHGREQSSPEPRHMRDVLREVHRDLVHCGLRDQVTLVACGGIALAEHLAKAIICGADMVAIDAPQVLALECRLCLECDRGQRCPVDLAAVDPEFAAGRIVNLLAAWHSQLLEMLGAMGIREVRRLRGETGRCMFFEDLERDTFGRMFGKRKAAVGEGC
ncbi:MAG: glutamate synthase-related protein [Phycisphaerae bacterium]